MLSYLRSGIYCGVVCISGKNEGKNEGKMNNQAWSSILSSHPQHSLLHKRQSWTDHLWLQAQKDFQKHVEKPETSQQSLYTQYTILEIWLLSLGLEVVRMLDDVGDLWMRGCVDGEWRMLNVEWWIGAASLTKVQSTSQSTNNHQSQSQFQPQSQSRTMDMNWY